ncbi:MAG: hypothetical protein AB1817_01595 [Chloroflexota bacterium]
MENYLTNLQRQYARQLASAAQDYLKVGLDQFHVFQQTPDYISPQSAVGNFAIALELMLKAFISSRHIVLLFKDLPLEVRALLLCSDELPNDFNWRAHDIELKSGTYKTLEFDECIAVFYLFIPPQLKQQLQSHLRFMSKSRNISVHSFLPSFQRYEVERAAYTALRIWEVLKTTKGFDSTNIWYSVRADEFIARFQESRLERVQKSIEAAKKRAKEMTQSPGSLVYISNHWETAVIKCPICTSDAVLFGNTEVVRGEPDQNGELPDPFLVFFPDSFQCDECGLTLGDYDELKLAGIPVDVDRYDRTKEMDRYLEERKVRDIHLTKNIG